MSDTDILKQLFKDSILKKPETYYDTETYVVLDDQNVNDIEESVVRINNVPADTIAISADSTHIPSRLFNCINNECKCADYILISENIGCVMFIELKTRNDREDDIALQLRGAECLFDYCKSIGASFWKKQDFLSGYKKRFVCFRHTSRQGKTTLIRPYSGIHDTPDSFLKINFCKTIQFRQIAGLNRK